MTAAAPAEHRGATPDLRRAALPLRRRLTEAAAAVAVLGAVVVAVIPLVMVTYTVLTRGASELSWSFLTEDIPNSYRSTAGGIGPAIAGTIVITGAAALMAVPLGVLGAIYLNECGRHRPLARLVRTMADVMTGVPSIVVGLFIYSAWVLLVGAKSGFAAALALACLMLPIVIRSSEEMLRLVPDELRQASAALGARRWRTTVSVVLPAAISGITSGALLAVARAAGETAPLIVVAGITFTTNWSLAGENTALPAQIFRNATQPFAGAQARAWGAALTLVVIVLVCTVAARVIASRFAVRER
jgi:phosphate transport system permease protein